jgi:hypothetical protein
MYLIGRGAQGMTWSALVAEIAFVTAALAAAGSANELSMTLVIRRCFQCSAGKKAAAPRDP